MKRTRKKMFYLNRQQSQKVEDLWNEGEDDTVINKKLDLIRADLRTLQVNCWLNDKVIDAYMELIMDRSNFFRPEVYIFSTHFYTALDRKGYDGVARWTSKVDIFSYDLILIPICFNNHWSLFSMSREDLALSYFDSMRYANETELNDYCLSFARKIRKYFDCEFTTKHKEKLVMTEGVAICNERLQENTDDCGVFVCCFAENLTRKYLDDFDFDYSDMLGVRQQICFELATGALLQS